jgi:hypothetical protein
MLTLDASSAGARRDAAGRLPAFLRANGFAVGGADAVEVLQIGQRVGIRSARAALEPAGALCDRRDEWRRFDDLDAWFLPANRWQQRARREREG